MVLPPSDLENDIANSVDKLQKLYPDKFDAKRYLYLPRGKYAFAAEHTFQGKKKKQLGLRAGYGYRTYARSGVIAGHNLTCIWKAWNVSKAWREFFQELYFYSHPKLLRWLQGIIVPHVIGVHDGSNGEKSIFMEAPHHTHWHTAHADLSIGEKQAIIRAYEALHAHGIMHNNICAHNICIDQDMNVTLLNFERACCLNDKGIDEVPGCDQEALKREMRQVKYLIDYMGARVIEREILAAPEAPPGEQQTEPLSIVDIHRWLSDVENTHTIPSNMRNLPLPNDGRGRAKKPKVKVGASSQMESAGPIQDAGNSGSQSEPIVPPILLPTVQSSSSAITSTPSPPLDSPADIRGFFSVDQLPLSNRHDALPSPCPKEDTSDTQDRDTVQQPPPGSDSESSQTAFSSPRDSYVHSPLASPFTPLLSLPPSTPSPISEFSAQIPQTSPSCSLSAHLSSQASTDHSQRLTFVQYLDQLPSPKVFCDLTHEQLRLAIKQHNAVVDARMSSQPAINTDKNNVVFHPDTNDNGTYATGSDPFRKRKKRRRLTPFFPEGSSSTEDETIPDEDEEDEDEEPEPQIEIDFEELVEEAQLAKLRGRRRISRRPSMLPSMVLAKSVGLEPEAKSPAVAQRSTSTPPSPALSSISEESSGDTSGAPPYSVVFVGANGCPEEVWKLPVPAFMLVKSSVARQPQAQKLRVEQAPRLRGPPLTNPSPPRATYQDTQSRSFKKRKINCVEGIEYLEQASKRPRQDQSTPSSCIIC